MKDYSMNEAEKNNYIIDVRRVVNENGEEEFQVVFADGEVFSGIEANEENLQKVEEQMQKQAHTGMARLSSFVKRKSKAVGAMILGGAATVASTIMFTTDFMNTAPTEVLPTAIGVIGVFSLIKGGEVYLKTAPKVKELRKIKYLDNHRKTLQDYNDYPNALEGLSNKRIDYFEEIEEPFLMVDLDDYTQEDLQTIMKNINREKEFQFTYNK